MRVGRDGGVMREDKYLGIAISGTGKSLSECKISDLS